MRPRIVIISILSGIGKALTEYWTQAGFDVMGTYRSPSEEMNDFIHKGVKLVHCDLTQTDSIETAVDTFQAMGLVWDALVFATGNQKPVGTFENCSIDEWTESVGVNFVNQMRLTHGLLPLRNKKTTQGPMVLYFAGGGTNNATTHYSAYTVSKISLIKMCELLDAEIPDTKFTIIGPGWVKTKIHNATVEAGSAAGANYQRTLDKLSGDEWTPMVKVVECCEWIRRAPRAIVGGRNFSTVFDPWNTSELNEQLILDPNMYRLRRSGNDFKLRMKR